MFGLAAPVNKKPGVIETIAAPTSHAAAIVDIKISIDAACMARAP